LLRSLCRMHHTRPLCRAPSSQYGPKFAPGFAPYPLLFFLRPFLALACLLILSPRSLSCSLGPVLLFLVPFFLSAFHPFSFAVLSLPACLFVRAPVRVFACLRAHVCVCVWVGGCVFSCWFVPFCCYLPLPLSCCFFLSSFQKLRATKNTHSNIKICADN